jgi:hypothetical protein
VSDLLPCPFCGGEAEWAKPAAYSVYCANKKQCHGIALATGATLEEAIAAWNRRQPVPAPEPEWEPVNAETIYFVSGYVRVDRDGRRIYIPPPGAVEMTLPDDYRIFRRRPAAGEQKAP